MMHNFEIHSGQVHLSDPCYEVGTWCGKYNVPVKNGKWVAEPEFSSEGRVAGWTAYHEDHHGDFAYPSFNFGVDSGQFGIFDVSIYDANTEYGEPGFYGDCCSITIDSRCGAISNLGFVSRTGWGDGEYTGNASFDQGGNLVKFSIEFL